MENNKRGRPREYLRLDEWRRFLSNDWKHLTWKVNGMIVLMSIIAIFLAVIFSISLTKLLVG